MNKNVKIFHCNTVENTKRTESDLPNNPLCSGDLNKTSQRGIWEERVAAHRRPLRLFCSWHWALCKGCSSPARSRCQSKTAKSSGRSRPTLKRKSRNTKLRNIVDHRSGMSEINVRRAVARFFLSRVSRKKRSFRDRRMSRDKRMRRRAKNSRESRVNEHATFSPSRELSKSLQIRSATRMLRMFQYNLLFSLRLSLRLEKESL